MAKKKTSTKKTKSKTVLFSSKKGNRDCDSALNLLSSYYEFCESEKPDKKLIAQIKKIVKGANSEFIVFSAADVLVKGGIISEFGAMDMVSDFREQF